MTVEDVAVPPLDRRFALPPAYAEVHTDKDSRYSGAPLATMIGTIGPILPRLAQVFRTGEGIPWQDYGPDLVQPVGQGGYHLAVVIEAVHDLPRPLDILRTARQMLAPGGVAIVADEKVGETITAPAEGLDPLCYAASVLSCLPLALAEQPSAATCTVIRRTPCAARPLEERRSAGWTYLSRPVLKSETLATVHQESATSRPAPQMLRRPSAAARPAVPPVTVRR